MRRSPIRLGTWGLLALAVGLYAVSFFLPAYRELQSGSALGGPKYRIDYGSTAFVSALIFGWPAWWANPASWVAVALLIARSGRAAVILAAIALALALSAIPLATVFQARELHRLRIGYWTWTAACATLVLACVVDRGAGNRSGRASGKQAGPPALQD